MEFIKIPKGRGFKYACENQLYSRYSHKKDVMYLKCDSAECKGAAKILDGSSVLSVTEPHDVHSTQEEEINKLALLNQCRKRAADDVATPLRQIFDDEARGAGQQAATSISFVNVESGMYKKRRLNQPALPLTADDVPAVLDGTRYSVVNDTQFFQGSINSGRPMDKRYINLYLNR